MLSGDDGIITNAQKASREQSHGAVREGMSLAYNEWRIEINTSSTTKLASTNVVQIQELSENPMETASDFLDYTLSKSYTDSDGIIDTEALIGTRQALGNGEGTNDVYKLEKINENYVVKYYENATNVLEIWGAGSNTEDTEDTETDWTEILEDANANPEKYKHPAQIVSEEIGIGTDGEPVNMDKWKPTFDNDSNSYILADDMYGNVIPYKGEIIEGRIEGCIPEYVYNEDEGKFLKITNIEYLFSRNTELVYAPEIPSSVTDMSDTFSGCTSLIKAPEIPDSVTDMASTFSECTSLTQAPEIPSSVTDMSATFSRCTSLIKAPEILDSVTDMDLTFSQCTSLTQAPEIPSSVTSMRLTFYRCTGLTQAPEIPSSVTNMNNTFSECISLTGNLIVNATLKEDDYYWMGCLSDAATNEGCNLVLSGSCPKLQQIYETANGNPNVTIKQ